MIQSTRRALALVSSLAALCACSAAPAPQAAAPDPLVGAGRSHITASSGALTAIPDLEFMTVFNAGGTLTESSNYDGAPPVPPAYGVWRKTADGAFQARHAFWVTKPPAALDALPKGGGWAPNGYGVLTETITLSADRQSYASTLTYVFFDAAGKPVDGGGSATGRGERMGF